MTALTILIVGLSIVSAEELCKQYICNSTTAKLDGVCLDSTATTVYGSKCQSTQICPIYLSSISEACINKSRPSTVKLLAGEKCSIATDCIYGQMANGYCLGKPAGMSCTAHSDCDVDLICTEPGVGSAKVCSPAKKQSEQCNFDDKLCSPGLYCDGTDFVCEYYGTDKIGTKVGTPYNYVECESFFVDPSDYRTCIAAPKRVGAQFVAKGATCTFTYTSSSGQPMTYTDPAVCGLMKNGSAICDPDYASLNATRKTYMKYIKNDNKSIPCHVHSFPFMPFCERSRQEVGSYMAAIKAFYDLNMLGDFENIYPTTVQVQECFKSVNRMYFYGGADTLTVLMALMLVVCLI